MSKREIYRILDAAANRGREALRVVEDAARFLGDSQDLAAKLKETRHRFAIAADKLDRRERMLARDTVGDVGVNIETQDEYRRSSLLDVLVANFARLEESARSLEEFSKIVQPELAREWEQIRYAAYTLEKIAYQSASSFGLDASDNDEEPSAPPVERRAAPRLSPSQKRLRICPKISLKIPPTPLPKRRRPPTPRPSPTRKRNPRPTVKTSRKASRSRSCATRGISAPPDALNSRVPPSSCR